MNKNCHQIRQNQFIRTIQQKKLDAFLVTDFNNVSYLTGFSGDDSFLFVTEKQIVILSDSRYEKQISEECPGLNALIRGTGQRMIDAIKELFDSINQSNSKRMIGLESSASIGFLELLQKNFPDFHFSAQNNLIEQQREIKDNWEIAAIRQSVSFAIQGLNEIRNRLNKNQTEKEIRNDLEYQMRCFGADDRGFPSIIAVGERAALPHAVPTDRFRVADSELILFDWGAKKDFYVSDLTRVLITKKDPSRQLWKIYNIVLQAQKAAIAAIRPGALSCEIDAAARNIIAEAGYGEAFGHGLGHGLGMVVHDFGGLRMGDQTPLTPGMVLTVEPGIYLPGWGGVRIEDDVLVTENGCEVLSAELPKEFEEMIVD
ncbi:MAG: Xaa-Pro peptidase family protein [Planctomycetia bacterium]|nr:Xaa-Pro peptidase family protein [Planctomycetia bacterium]